MRGLIREVRDLVRVMTSKPVWLCGIAIVLWGLNSLSLQEVSFEHRGTIAISHSRLEALQTLANSKGKGTPYRFLECKLCPDEAASQHHSDMRTVRLRVRSKSHSDLVALDEFLLAATEPRSDSIESRSILREVRNSRWVQEALTHQQARIQVEQNAKQKHLEVLAALNSNTSPQGIPVHFVTHRNSHSSPQYDENGAPDAEVDSQLDTHLEIERTQGAIAELDSLASALAAQQQGASMRLESHSDRLAASRANTAGYLSFTGAQEYFPVAMPVGWDRLVLASIVFLTAWCLVGIFTQQLPATLATCKSVMLRRLDRSVSNRSQGKRSGGQDLGIPCLGSLEVFLESPQFARSIEPTPVDILQSTMASNPVLKPVATKSQFVLEVWLQNAATLAVATWALIFAIRFLVDGVWRDLFLASPLAGLLHLLTGAP